jgi:hypothetical protein
VLVILPGQLPCIAFALGHYGEKQSRNADENQISAARSIKYA